MKRVLSADLVAPVLILLFGSAALRKVQSFDRFRGVLQKAPVIYLGADVVAWVVVLIEAAIVLLLLFPATRLKGLWASAGLLSLFTVYLLLMLAFAPHLPCSCGGVISGLSWKGHVGMNVGLVCATAVAIRDCRRMSNE